MGSSDPGNLTQAFIDYRPTRCRCNAVVHPHHVQCLHCGRRQNLLFEGLEKVDAENLMELVSKLQEEFRAIPYDYLVQHKLGKAYILLGKYDEARTVLGALLQKKTDLWDARLNLGILHACLGEKELAVTELEYWLRNNPHSSKA
ncbi:MAG TPA: tetratricopeptide repeat protein, partial [bacterium]